VAKKSKIKLKPGARIGQLAAEDDHRFLNDCFVAHPILTGLKDVVSHQCLLLGRTGAGKSALLWHFETTLPNVSRINPKDVAFQYIGNSAIIRQISDLGVDLHLLYEFLWIHILTLHITRECLGIHSQDGLLGMLASIRNLIWLDQKRKIVTDYLQAHADSFWINVEHISSEITHKFSERLAAVVGLSAPAFKAKVEAGDDWEEGHKRTFRYRAQEAVEALQIRDLKETINALAACIDKSKTYYILIDDLDREWAGSDATQYALIRALIETLKTFRRVTNVKIIVALREDLFEATLRTTTDKHFQAEKLEGIICRLRWDNQQLFQLIEKRIQQLFRFEYMRQEVSLESVLPAAVVKQPVRHYLVERTLRRPRDIIAFVNKILSENENESLPLPARTVTQTEPAHSRDRLRALEDEWRSCHPLVSVYLKALSGINMPNTIDVFTEERMFTILYEASELKRPLADQVERAAAVVYERDKALRIKKLAISLLACLYKIGTVGIKLHATQSYVHCYDYNASLAETELEEQTRFIVHPMLISALGCRPPNTQPGIALPSASSTA